MHKKNNASGTAQGSARLWATGKSELAEIAAQAHLGAPGQRGSRMPHTLSSPQSCWPCWFQSLATAASTQWRLQSSQQHKCSPPPRHPAPTNNCCTQGGVERCQTSKKHIITAKLWPSPGFGSLWGSGQAEDAWHLHKLFLQLLSLVVLCLPYSTRSVGKMRLICLQTWEEAAVRTWDNTVPAQANLTGREIETEALLHFENGLDGCN